MNEAAEQVAHTDGASHHPTPPVAEATAEVEQKPTKVKLKKLKEQDLLVQIVQEISELSSQEAIDAVPFLLNSADENFFRLGGVLSEIQTKKHYVTLGYDTFKTFVETHYGLQYRKAMYWVQIYDKLIESGVSWNKVGAVGWTKLKDLVMILTTENVDEWVKKAMGCTVLQLQEAIKKASAGALPNSGITPNDDHKSEVTTVTYKVHADQKTIIQEAVAKARHEANTEFDGVALEAICMNYLSGGNVGKPPSLSAVMQKYSAEDVLLALETAFPDFEVTAKLKKKA